MSIQMYMVGGVLFAIYIYFTIWNIFRNNKAQQPRKESQSSVQDSADKGGMGSK
tara:strand:- start:223 stop:384 length:162 start_codon:yes stop_codon:yes gene_type:complete